MQLTFTDAQIELLYKMVPSGRHVPVESRDSEGKLITDAFYLQNDDDDWVLCITIHRDGTYHLLDRTGELLAADSLGELWFTAEAWADPKN